MLPLFYLVFGVVQYGFFFWSMQGAADAARQAARLAAVGKPTDCTDFRDQTRSFLGSTSPTPSGATVSRTYYQPGTTILRPDGGVQIGDTVEVTVVSPAYQVIGLVPQPSTITNTAQARVDYLPDASIGSCSP
jgi:Flp pilus assembly protein TadG